MNALPRLRILWLALVLLGAPASAADLVFPLDLSIIDPDSAEELPPYLVMFPGGKDDRGRDVTRPLGRLEALRGASKMFPESNKDAGLPVVLRGIRIHQKLDAAGKPAGYDVELQGEFNMVKTPAEDAEVTRFLSGDPATFSLKAEKNYGIYSYVSTTKITLQRDGDHVTIWKLEGDFQFREGLRTYTSPTNKLNPPQGRDYLYRGQRAILPKLPSI
jgi:hypothetical protein